MKTRNAFEKCQRSHHGFINDYVVMLHQLVAAALETNLMECSEAGTDSETVS